MLIWDSPEVVNKFIAQHGGGYQTPGSFQALGWVDSSGQLIAGVTFFECNGRHTMMSIAAPFQKFPRGFIKAIGNYVCHQLKLTRLTFIIEEANIASQRLVRHFGAKHEATLQDAGRTGHLLVFALFTDKCPIWSKLNAPRR